MVKVIVGWGIVLVLVLGITVGIAWYLATHNVRSQVRDLFAPVNKSDQLPSYVVPPVSPRPVQSLLERVHVTPDKDSLFLVGKVEKVVEDDPYQIAGIIVSLEAKPEAKFLVQLGRPGYQLYLRSSQGGGSVEAWKLVKQVKVGDKIRVEIGFPGGGLDDFETSIAGYEVKLGEPFIVPYGAVMSVNLFN